MEVVRIPIGELDGSYQTRVQTDDSTVEKYANDFNEYGGWGDFPPLEVIIVCGVKHIANGIHRYKAAKLAGLSECPCTVREGTLLCDCAERPQTKTAEANTGVGGQPNPCSGVSARLGERVTWRLLKQHF